MNKILIFILACFITSCSCPDCETFPEPLRIIYTDNEGTNLLKNNGLTVVSILSSPNEQPVQFVEKDFVVQNSIEKTHIEILSETFYDNLINSENFFYIHFDNGDVDTLIYGIKEIEGKCCSSYKDLKFIYNADDLTGLQENTIGAYIVTK